MSEPSAVVVSDTSLPLLQARAGLAGAGGVLAVQDQLDLAELCVEHGQADGARLLFEAAFLNQGFSRQRLAEQATLDRRTGLWRSPASLVSTVGAARPTVEIALEEIRAFAGAAAAGLAHRLDGRRSAIGGETAPHLTSPAGQATAVPPAADLGALVHDLFRRLSRPGFPSDPEPLRTALATARAATGSAAFDLARFVAAPLPLLAAAVGYNSVQAFLSDTRDLAVGPLGSAEVLHRAARFDSAGLGPYFGNVAQIARSSRDLQELAEAATDAAREQGVKIGLEPWICLLSRRLSGPLLNELIDDLGDVGDSAALSLILSRLAGRRDAEIDFGLVARVRDTALDNLDYDLASRAQGLAVRLRPDSRLERVILGTIDASAGRRNAAEQDFLAALDLKQETASEADTADTLARLEALRSACFQPFAVRQGYGSPKGRQARRLRRRAGQR